MTPGAASETVTEIGGDARPLVIDVADEASIAAAAAPWHGWAGLDIPVNNAGISGELAGAGRRPAAFRRVFETNVIGVVAVTNAFLPGPRRSASPRIVNTSSGTGSLAVASSQESAGFAAYRSSKTALNMLTVLYSKALAADGVKVNALAPGLRRTDLNARAAASEGDPAEAAAGAVRLALLPDDGLTGGFFSWDGSIVPW